MMTFANSLSSPSQKFCSPTQNSPGCSPNGLQPPGKGDLANNLANFELANQILVGEPNFDLANTNEFFANPNKIWRTEMRLGELHFELREQNNFYQWDQMVNFSNFRQKIFLL